MNNKDTRPVQNQIVQYTESISPIILIPSRNLISCVIVG